eukprot:Rmarinus@m.16207
MAGYGCVGSVDGDMSVCSLSVDESLISEETTPLVRKKDLFNMDSNFASLVEEIEAAIKTGVYAIRIPQGSSGSYFMRDRTGRVVAVFKPKNEEPYGHLNPKWTKWFQKLLFPCCFGRGCLLPNQGYMSEAGTSLVDAKLGLDIVPKTRVVRLSCPTFNYSAFRRKLCQQMNQPLPTKVGSLQVYVEGYSDAASRIQSLSSGKLPAEMQTDFRRQFERLCILDYVIRNTDRTLDNWLIKIDKTIESENEIMVSEPDDKPRLRIAAIDNGLSFPFKHPDNWRTYPYSWAFLDLARVPFSQEIRDRLLPQLEDEKFADDLSHTLLQLFKKDPAFDKSMFLKQMSLMRGQIQNCAKALREGMSPYEMVQLPTFLVKRRKDDETLIRSYLKRQPCFSWC